MTFSPSGDLWPVQVRIVAEQLERRALAEGLAERAERADGFGEPSPARERLDAPASSEDDTRIWRYRALAALISLLCAGAFAVLGVAIVTSDLSLVAALATLAVFGFALTLLEAWALPSFYRWCYWRWLLVSWR